MFNVGGGEVLVILLLALIVLGPDKLPNAAKQAGKYLSEFRRMSNGFQQEIRNAMDLDPTKPVSAPPPANVPPEAAPADDGLSVAGTTDAMQSPSLPPLDVAEAPAPAPVATDHAPAADTGAVGSTADAPATSAAPRDLTVEGPSGSFS